MKHAKTALFLFLSQFVYVVFMLVWLIFAVMTLLSMDQFDDLNAMQAICLILVWCYPIGFLGAGVASWVLYHKRRFKQAFQIGWIPLLWALPLAGFFTL